MAKKKDNSSFLIPLGLLKTKTILKVVIVSTSLVVALMYFRKDRVRDMEHGNLHVNIHKRVLKLSSEKNPAVLEGIIGLGIPHLSPPPIECPGTGKLEKNGACFEWNDVTRLSILSQPVKATQCYRVKWESLNSEHTPMDCFNMKGSYWYGGSEFYSQRWPINPQRLPMQQFRSVDYLFAEEFHDDHGPIVEPYWFSSQGVSIYVESEEVPLHVGMNEVGDGRLCLSANLEGSTISKYRDNKRTTLEYIICQAANAKDIHSFMAEHFISRPSSLVDERMLSSPVWSTWARYKTDVNQSKVMEYASEIEKYGFSYSQIEIDDMYTTTYGDYEFDKKKFPDPKAMVTELHRRGFRVTSWVIPFANYDSKAFEEGLKKKYWVQNPTNSAPGLVHWWQGTGAILDVTNRKAVDWFVNRLEVLRQDIGIDSFKFDAGEVGHLPEYIGTLKQLDNPNGYTAYYAQLIARFGGMTEMRSSYRNQNLPIFFRMMDKDSTWSFNNGLMTMIPTALMMSMTGYHFILPDMIGGNGYGVDGDNPFTTTSVPDRELFIRWVQLCAYLPSMQFSFTPWQYDAEVIRISKQMVEIHKERVTPVFLKAARDMMKSGKPIIRPIWWIDPDDKDALSMETEFLVGDEILVAPILASKSRARDVYLPRGRWRDDLKNKELLGRTWLRGYQVELSEIPTFTYISDV